MRKFLLLIILGLGLVYADCSDGDEFNADGYHCGDIQVLQDFIDLNDSLIGQSPLDIGEQEWDENESGSLEYLSLYNNQLTILPESIGDLSSLVQLYLSHNQLSSIPESIGDLSNLEYLYLDTNQLTSIPETIGNLSNLGVLVLGDNQLSSIPLSIGNLSNLRQLYVAINQLTSIPESIGNLSSLEFLNLWGNQLTILPENIWNLSSLEDLNLSDNQFTSIPESIGELSNLEELHLTNNQLTSLPESIGNLSNLKYFSLGFNQFTSIPESIGELNNLEYLYLSYNQLTSLPESICNLPVDGAIYYSFNNLCEEYHYDCIDDWGTQDQSNCCEGPNGESNWTNCTDCLYGDYDQDGLCDDIDTDDDNDGALDDDDTDDNNPFECSDNDNDGCEDCSSGIYNPANDGLDEDGDGQCDVGDIDLALHEGANLISFFALPANGDYSVSNIFGDDGNVVKVFGEGLVAYNHPIAGWVGALTDVAPEDGYWAVADVATTIEVSGPPTAPVSYEVHEGNNFLSYAYSTGQSIESALPLNAVDNTLYIYGKGIAALNTVDGWVGSLESFKEGQGYWVGTMNNFVFSYNVPSQSHYNPTPLPEVPLEFSFNQSMSQYFYFVEEATIEGSALNNGDWLVAYDNDVVVGARMYSGNNMFDIPIMGSVIDPDIPVMVNLTAGYCVDGDIPTIKIHRTTGEIIDMYVSVVDGSLAFQGFGHAIVTLESAIWGCTDPDSCNYNPEANTDAGSCIYPEENYDCDGNCTAQIDCNDECGGDGSDCCILGDLTCDGLINVVDIVALVSMILADEYSPIADLTQDGLVNVVDIVQMVNWIIYGIPVDDCSELIGTWEMETYNWCGGGTTPADSGEYFIYDGTNYQQISGGEVDEEGTYTCSDNQLDWCASNGDCSNSTIEIVDSNYLTIIIDVGESGCDEIILTFTKNNL